MTQPFEHCPKLTPWIERLANSSLPLSLIDWDQFVDLINTVALDAARYHHFRDHHSYRYGMTQNSPLETGIEYHVQPLTPEKQGYALEDFIDEDIERMRHEAEEDAA